MSGMTEQEALELARELLGESARVASRRGRVFAAGRGPMLFEIFKGDTLAGAGRSWWEAVARMREEHNRGGGR